jgi:hypothetical protein
VALRALLANAGGGGGGGDEGHRTTADRLACPGRNRRFGLPSACMPIQTNAPYKSDLLRETLNRPGRARTVGAEHWPHQHLGEGRAVTPLGSLQGIPVRASSAASHDRCKARAPRMLGRL